MGGLINLSVDVEALKVLADGAAVAGVVVGGHLLLLAETRRCAGRRRHPRQTVNARPNKFRYNLLLIVPSKRHVGNLLLKVLS